MFYISLFYILQFSSFGTDKFEYVRNLLKQNAKIAGARTTICKPNGKMKQCTVCTITQICAVKVKTSLMLNTKIGLFAAPKYKTG